MSSLVYSPTTGPGSQKVILKKSVECLHMQMRAVFPSVYSTEHQFNGMLCTKRTVLLSMKFGNATVSLPGNFQCLDHKAYQQLRTSQGACLTSTNTNSFDQRTVYFNQNIYQHPQATPLESTAVRTKGKNLEEQFLNCSIRTTQKTCYNRGDWASPQSFQFNRSGVGPKNVAFLTSSQLMLLVSGPHLGKHRSEKKDLQGLSPPPEVSFSFQGLLIVRRTPTSSSPHTGRRNPDPSLQQSGKARAVGCTVSPQDLSKP